MRKMLLFVVAALVQWTMVASAPALAQTGFDRPGNDYRRFVVPGGDPAECAMSCERDKRCRAWSFNYPSGKAGGAVCWLKDAVPKRTANSCCITGVRGAGVVERRSRSMETAIDRIGGDLRDFDLKPGQGDDACRQACDSDDKCRAWTFARAGYVSKNPRCYLKQEVKPPQRSPCCISGVLR